MSFTYAITAVKTSDPVFISDYESFIRKIKEQYPYSEFEYNFEERRAGVSDRLHIHGTLSNFKKVNYKRIYPGPGWSVNYKENPDAGWNVYCTKYNAYETDLINRQHDLEKEYNDFQKASKGGARDGSLSTNEVKPCGVSKPDDTVSQNYSFPKLDIRKLLS